MWRVWTGFDLEHFDAQIVCLLGHNFLLRRLKLIRFPLCELFKAMSDINLMISDCYYCSSLPDVRSIKKPKPPTFDIWIVFVPLCLLHGKWQIIIERFFLATQKHLTLNNMVYVCGNYTRERRFFCCFLSCYSSQYVSGDPNRFVKCACADEHVFFLLVNDRISKKVAIWVRFAQSCGAKRKSRFRQEFWNQSSIVDYIFEWWYFVVMIRLKPICSNLQKRSMRGEERS